MGKTKDDSIRMFSLNGNRSLAEKIAQSMGRKLNKCSVKQFSDGEIQINIEESVRGKDVFVIQATSDPVDDNLMELLIMIDALKRASAKTVNVVLSYYGYARQDRTAKPREPISAKLVANLIQKAGATRVLVLDLHAVQVQGFFDIPVDNLFTMPLFAKCYRDRGFVGDDFVVVAPKNSGVNRARSLGKYLDTTIAIVDNEHKDEATNTSSVIGHVRGKKCILVDDIVNTAGTLINAVEALEQEGAEEIYACASHGVLSATAAERINHSALKEICVTDSIALDPELVITKLHVVTCADLMGEAIKRIYENKAMSPLFQL